MEIRRVEQDRIQPPAANPQGPRVEIDKQPSTPQRDQDEDADTDTPEDSPEETSEEVAPDVSLTAYDRGGRVKRRDPSPPEGQHFDQTV